MAVTSTRIEEEALEKLKTIANVSGRSATKHLTKLIDREFEAVTSYRLDRQKDYIDHVAKHGTPPDALDYIWNAEQKKFVPRHFGQ